MKAQKILCLKKIYRVASAMNDKDIRVIGMAQSNHQIVIRVNYVIRLLEALGRGNNNVQ